MRMWNSFSLKPFQGGGSDDIARVQINLLPKFWSTNYKFVTSYPFAFELIMKHCIVADRYMQGLVMQMRLLHMRKCFGCVRIENVDLHLSALLVVRVPPLKVKFV